MPTPSDPPRFGARGRNQDDVASLLRQIQELALRLEKLKRKHANDPERAETERALDQLRWRLAAAARRAADRDLGAAA
jgi:hypothetical protein